jgi:hypothetical protein
MSDKGSRGRSGRAPQTVREDAIIYFIEPVTFGFFGSVPTVRSAPEVGRSSLGLGRCLLFLRMVCSVDLCFCIGSVRGSPWCRERSALRCFSKKLLLSGIIYGIPDSQFRIVVDKLMHLWNDQLDKLVSPQGL